MQERAYWARRCGHPTQLYGSRLMTLEEGAARGARLCQVWTAAGLEFDLLPDCGMDLGLTRFRGRNCCYVTKNGYTGPTRHLALPGEFDHSFSGGMLFTCGLLNVGPECRDDAGDGEFHPLHGRFHGLSCEGFCHRIEKDVLILEGVLRETEQWRHALEVHRRYEVPLWGSEIRLTDRIVNLTPEVAEVMMLYHVNFGAPFLDGETVIQWGAHDVTPRTVWAEEHLESQARFEEPSDGMEERVYFNENFDSPSVRVCSPGAGIEACLSWTQDTLPRLSQWKTTRSGEYCLALEPSTCYTAGRAEERAKGTLVTIQPWGERVHGLTLTFEEVRHDA